MKIVDTFQITGRGLAVVVERTIMLPVGKKLVATVVTPDGATVRADAWKEYFMRRDPTPIEKEAYLLRGLSKEDVPVGSDLSLALPEALSDVD